jgi:hypothetical protein
VEVSGLSQKVIVAKFTAVTVAALIVISSAAIINVIMYEIPEDDICPNFDNLAFDCRPCEVSSVLSQEGLWVAFDSSAPGTPAEVHVTISDTSGITIVADFHGFWRNNITIDETEYDNLVMPGSTSIHEAGKPMLPLLFEYVEIPHHIDISAKVIASSFTNTSGYSIRPAPLPIIPVGIGEQRNSTISAPEPPVVFGPEYSNNAFFPSTTTEIDGALNESSMIMRGHRMLGLRLYPVQFNNGTGDLIVYSQLVIKLKYSFPAQILPVEDRLRSEAFERILINILLNYESSYDLYDPNLGIAMAYPPPPFTWLEEGAEYLIVTTAPFEDQANRLADWKEQKGVPTKVVTVGPGATTTDVKSEITDAYTTWFPVPTYVLLLGDVDDIPANYDFEHPGRYGPGLIPPLVFEEGSGEIASDLGYFNLEGSWHIPDMIYSRISVDTEDQARDIVSKIIRYEQAPTIDPTFYNSILSAGYFNDKPPNRDGVEDAAFPFLYYLERIRHYLEDNYGYDVHTNYSCAWLHYDSENYDYPYLDIPLEDLKFHTLLNPLDPTSDLVIQSLPDDHEWLWGYYYPDDNANARGNITNNLNEGRFFVLYYGHGGSKNMIYRLDVTDPPDGFNRDDRDVVEGWESPYYDTSYFSDLWNVNTTSFILSMACNSGWFDGETDQLEMDLNSDYTGTIMLGEPNPFSEYENECFAEEMTRHSHGGAIGIIAASRPAFGIISGYLLNGIVQAFWPGFMGSQNQPMYEMGTALLFGKLQSAQAYGSFDGIVRTTFEEYHLFGDPETQLWTHMPRKLDVSHPISIGTNGPQRFVVTVRESGTGVPVNFAKVCIQQGTDKYQVGYTDLGGQVIFDLTPSRTPTHVNITVTKHNFKPYTWIIRVHESDAMIVLSQYSGIGNEEITITQTGFPEVTPVWVYFNDQLVAELGSGTGSTTADIPSGPSCYLNVWAVVPSSMIPSYMWEPVSTERFARISEEEGPDPYIYSQEDPNTWDVTGSERVWDNPDIIIYRNGIQVDSMIQNEVHDIEVIVHNRGSDPADSTSVILSYAPFGGGVSWKKVGEYIVAPDAGGTDIAYFTLTPLLPRSACLRIDLSNLDENPLNTINNIGYENVDVIEMDSPGIGSFIVGNPTSSANYVFIKVKQFGNYDDVWNATILGYSSQAMNAGANETVSLFVDSFIDIQPNQGRLFTVETYVNGECTSGMVFNATKLVDEGLDIIELLKILIVCATPIAIVVGVIYLARNRIRRS